MIESHGLEETFLPLLQYVLERNKVADSMYEIEGMTAPSMSEAFVLLRKKPNGKYLVCTVERGKKTRKSIHENVIDAAQDMKSRLVSEGRLHREFQDFLKSQSS